MAEQIPYKPVPTVTPVETGAPQIHEQLQPVKITNAVSEALNIVGTGTGVLGDAYKAIGESYGKLGRSFEGAGDEVFARAIALQKVGLDKNIDDQELALTMKNSDIMERALADPNLGPDGLKAKIKETMDNRAAMEEGLKTPYEKEQFRKKTMTTITSDARRLASHVATTERKSVIDSAEANIAMEKKKAADINLSEEERAEAQERVRKKTIETLAPARGLQGAALEKRLQDDVDDIRGNQILAVADTDSAKAWEMLQASKNPKDERNYISDPDKQRQVFNTVMGKITSSISLNAANSATQDPKVTVEQAENAAGNEATKVAREMGLPGDAQIQVRNDAITRAGSKVSQQNHAKEDTDGKNVSDLSKKIMGGNEGGHKLSTMDELEASSPGAKAQFESMDFNKQQQIRQLLLKPPEDSARTADNTSLYHGILGALSGNAGNEKRIFAMNNINPYTIPNMPMAWRDDIWKKQQEERKRGREAAENSNVRQLFEQGKGERLIPTDLWKEDSEGYQRWVGAAGPALDAEQETKQRPLTREEKSQVIKDITQKQLGLTHDPAGRRALYEMKPDEREKARIKAERPGTTDEEATRIFQDMVGRNRLKILEDLKKGAKPETQTRPPADLGPPTGTFTPATGPAPNITTAKTKPASP